MALNGVHVQCSSQLVELVQQHVLFTLHILGFTSKYISNLNYFQFTLYSTISIFFYAIMIYLIKYSKNHLITFFFPLKILFHFSLYTNCLGHDL